jgi:hypothetical protein
VLIAHAGDEDRAVGGDANVPDTVGLAAVGRHPATVAERGVERTIGQEAGHHDVYLVVHQVAERDATEVAAGDDDFAIGGDVEVGHAKQVIIRVADGRESAVAERRVERAVRVVTADEQTRDGSRRVGRV